MSKHTPGPWRAQEDVVFLGGNASMHDESTWINCNTAANARLIAAAPELLEALKELTAWDLENLPELHGGYGGIEEDIAKAKEAIAKAMGEIE